ncbi:DUF211 domain-containing protein [Thioalbus denitrificans]|uniref:DUF211 domain-containing protein n=1 Tax=Thioalbus denitrificans TaxID=547122 RepID=A0A369BTS5_9GAMM|nr:DUF211 domain-containing protein [Thioalbus denitrificans]RCX24963.1 hypothetical protein DFQ59_11359 [Thioalbus denitrificans]
MVEVKRLVLDVLKPHHPDGLEFSRHLAAICGECRLRLTVMEVDENTETLQLVVEGESLDFERLRAAIGEMGASLHSIDEVEVVGGADTEG